MDISIVRKIIRGDVRGSVERERERWGEGGTHMMLRDTMLTTIIKAQLGTKPIP